VSVATEAKATRLLAERRVQVKFCTDGIVAASVLGDHGIYDIRWNRLTGWSCSCPSWHRRCTHVEAVAGVTMKPVAKAKS
jgi:hypothetical protein